jgi:glyoxylase-like metal-dependent hydrolase (beta-lactamase superfamily II)
MTDLLLEGPVSPSSISSIVLSHLHFDHVGDCTKFPHAELIAGPGSRTAASPGWPQDPNSPFPAAVLMHPRYHELSFESDTWTPFGPFPRAYDFFGDASFFLLDTPGHMPGHLAGLALVGPNEWVFMGGDCAHHRALVLDSRPMSVTVGPAGTSCFHRDPEAAKATLAKIRALERKQGMDVLVALAHDHYLVGRMPEYPVPVNGWKGSQWKREMDEAVKIGEGIS